MKNTLKIFFSILLFVVIFLVTIVFKLISYLFLDKFEYNRYCEAICEVVFTIIPEND